MADSGSRYDAIVVGLGGMGSAALFHIAQRNQKVLGLEQYGIAHDRGSSHGESRIIRLAYHEHPDYVPLLLRAYELWQELERQYGQELLCVTGSLEACSSETPDEQKSVFRDALQSALAHSLTHEVLSASQVNSRFPGYHLPADYQALYQPQGGLLASERCIEAHVALAQQAGAEVRTGEAVTSWHREASPSGESDIAVVTNRGSYRCRKLLLTAGAWLPQLVPALQACTSVQRNVIGWFEIREPGHFRKENFPVFIVRHSDGEYYGFPQYEYPGMKIGRFYHLKQQVADPAGLDRTITAEDEQALRQCVDGVFPTAAGSMTKAAACMFTNTPDTRFIIDFHPQHEEVILCSACSGHGFKFCSVIGEILADLALEGSTRHNIAAHRIDATRPKQKEFLDHLEAGTQEALLKDLHAPASRL